MATVPHRPTTCCLGPIAPESGHTDEVVTLIDRTIGIVRRAQFDPAGHCCFTVGDFSYRWQTEAEAAGGPPVVRFWRDDSGADSGFAWVSGQDLHIVHRSDPGLQPGAILDWGESIAVESGLERPLQIHLVDAADGWRSELTARGYRPAEPALRRQSICLAGQSEPLFDVGTFEVTSADTHPVAEGWASAYRQAFAPESMTSAVRWRIERSPLYRPDLDLVAIGRGGEIAAFALVWLDPESKIGTFEPVGCVPAYRRRGLARMLMVEGLARLRSLGAERAIVISPERRRPANALYQSVGFETVASSRAWIRRVR